MFENLTGKFEEIFSSLKKAPSLNEKQVDEGLRKIRQALLEADVALPVAKELIKNIKPKAIGQEIIRSTTPGQMIIKVVFDEIVKILGDTKSELNLNAVPPVCLIHIRRARTVWQERQRQSAIRRPNGVKPSKAYSSAGAEQKAKR